MSDRFHIGTFLWGLVLTLTGAVLAGVGFGWWEMFTINWAYFGPAVLIVVGVIILTSTLMSGNDRLQSKQ